jgi:alpha-glucosidase
VLEYDVHNLFGLMEEKTTHLALQQVLPGKRPFMISRSTFPSSGRWTGHWLGDNWSQWDYLHYSIAGVLQFQIFQVPFVGADACGFNANTTEELCNRWMQLAAFTPFYRNHNINTSIPQEPYRWPSVANASITAIGVRYSLLTYWYTLFADASRAGTPPVRALFFEFPDEPELFGIDSQLLIGNAILVTPVLSPGVTTVQGQFPGRGDVLWRDWYTHEVVTPDSTGQATLSAPLGHINVHVRDGTALLLHSQPGYTTFETLQSPYSLLVMLDRAGTANGSAYMDDGISFPPGPSRTVAFSAGRTHGNKGEGGTLMISGRGPFAISQKVQQISIVGVPTQPNAVSLDGVAMGNWTYAADKQELIVGGVAVDLNVQETALVWD